MNKKGFVPAIVGTEIHYLLIGIVIGIVLILALLILGRTGALPFSLCSLVCG